MDKAVIDLINKMFEIAGHQVTFEHIKDRRDDWYCQWEMTVEQQDEWMIWGMDYLKKTFRWSTAVCKKEMSMFTLNYGLKFNNSNLNKDAIPTNPSDT